MTYAKMIDEKQAEVTQVLKELGFLDVEWEYALTSDEAAVKVYGLHLGVSFGCRVPFYGPALLHYTPEIISQILQTAQRFKESIGLTPIDAAKKLTGWPVDPETTKVIEHPAKDQHREPRGVFNIPDARKTQIEMKKYQNDSGFSIWLGYDPESDILVWCPYVA